MPIRKNKLPQKFCATRWAWYRGCLPVSSSWYEPASFRVVLGDFGCDVTCQACQENSLRTIALGSKPPLVTRMAWTGLGTRLGTNNWVGITCMAGVRGVQKGFYNNWTISGLLIGGDLCSIRVQTMEMRWWWRILCFSLGRATDVKNCRCFSKYQIDNNVHGLYF